MHSYQKTFAALLAAFSCTGALSAANLTWDASGVATTGPADGAGTWNTTGTNWNNGSASIAWPNTNADLAIFGAGNGAAGTISVGAVTANGLTFNAAGSGNYTLSGGTITLSGATPTITANVGATIGSVIAGTAGLTKSGAGALTLSGVNTYSGGTTINQGTLGFSASNNIGSGSITFGGGTLRYEGSATNVTVNRALVLTAAGGTLENAATGTGYVQYSGALSYSGSGARTLTLSGNSASTFTSTLSSVIADGTGGATSLIKNGTASWTISGANTYTGDTTVNAGVLYTNGANRVSTSGTVTIASGSSLRLGGNQTLANLQGGGTLEQAFANSTTYTATIGSGNFSGTIKDSSGTARKIAVTKDTGGTLTLSGTLSYTGTTAINGGTLKLGSTTAVNLTGTSGVTIAGGTLTNAAGDSDLGTGAVTMSSGAITPGGVGTIGSFTLAANQAFTATGGTLNIDLSSASSFDQIFGGASGSFSLTDTTIALSGLTSIAGTYQVFSGFGGSNTITNLSITGVGSGFTAALDNTGLLSITASAIPEPSAYGALAGVAMLGFAALRRRRA